MFPSRLIRRFFFYSNKHGQYCFLVKIKHTLRHSGRILKMVTEMGSSVVGGMSSAMTEGAADSFLKATEKEKQQMQSLNDRLGNYISRVKGLEEQNRKLVADLEELRGRWGKDTLDIKVNAVIGLIFSSRAVVTIIEI